MNDMIAQDIEHVHRPSEMEVQKSTEKTKEALEKIVNGRISSGKTKHNKSLGIKESSFIRYQPNEALSSSTETRIVKMVEAPIDPLEPSRFKHRKVPRGPPSPPPPVLQSPPRKVTAEQQKEWVIPPCISNWKNAKGYTIPLDKRLANDGRGLQDININDNFAKLSEALFIADRHAREEVKLRGEMQIKLSQKEKKAKEEKVRLFLIVVTNFGTTGSRGTYRC
jgi:SNW domain-containing protein 1